MPKFLPALCLFVLLSACGQSGALYLPDHRTPPAQHKDQSAGRAKVGSPAAATTDATKPDAATKTAAPGSDDRSTPTPAVDDSTVSTPSPTP